MAETQNEVVETEEQKKKRLEEAANSLKNLQQKPKKHAVKPKAPHMVYKTGGPADVPQIGLGTTVVITPASGTAVTAVKVQSIKLPTVSGKDVETTGMSDTYDQYIPGVLNVGEAELDLVYLKTQSAAIEAMVNLAGTTFVFTYPDTRVKTFTGFINSFGEEVPLKEKINNKVKIRATTRVVNS